MLFVRRLRPADWCLSGLLGIAGILSGCQPQPAENKQPEQSTVETTATTTGANTGMEPVTAPASSDSAAKNTSDRSGEASMLAVQSESFGTTPKGDVITQYRLTNSRGLVVKLINLGATLTAVEVLNADGTRTNITLGFQDLDGYLANKPYFGSICGRYANRIANAAFELDGKQYTLAKNTGTDHLHGGLEGFNKKVWKAEELPVSDSAAVRFTYVSPDGEEGYPGNLTVVATYSLNEENELRIDYTATTDAATVLNITNHAYWNLSGDPKQTVRDHELTLFASHYLPVTEKAIPTGELARVDGTEMDFLKPHLIGERIEQAKNGNGGYDHCWVVDGEAGTLRPAARVVHPASGRVFELFTTEPGVQLYTGNYLNGTPDTGNAIKQGAFCLEAQHLPNSPNTPEFPSTVLRPGEKYTQTTVHKFSQLPK